MATRSSARLAALSPPPLDLAPPKTAMSNSSKPTISSVEWTQAKLDEYNIKLVETSNLESFLPKQYTTDNEGQSSVNIPDMLLLDYNDNAQRGGDLLIASFFNSLRAVGSLISDNFQFARSAVEEYSKFLLYDFMRILSFSNSPSLATGESVGSIEISPPSRITFDIANIKCIVKNNGGVSVVVPAEHGNRRAFPISFEAQYQGIDGEPLAENGSGRILAQLLASILDSSCSITGEESFVVQILGTKAYIYYAKFPSSVLLQIATGKKVEDETTIYRYPANGFDLLDSTQRKDLYTAMFNIFKYITSSHAKLSFSTQESPPQQIAAKEIVVINGPISEATEYLERYTTRPPRFTSPRRQPRTPSPSKRGRSPKRKLNEEADLKSGPRQTPTPPLRPPSPKRKLNEAEPGLESPRPTKRTATEDSKLPLAEEPKSPPKLNSFGFGAKVNSSPWAVPASSSQERPESKQPEAAKKTFGFGVTAAGVSPFSAVAQSSNAWAGWENQKPAVFEKKSLFGTPTVTTPVKKPVEEKKQQNGDSEDDNISGDEEFDNDNDNDNETSPEDDLEEQDEEKNEKRKESEKPQNVDIREQAGESHEETLYETTCTLYETSTGSAGWTPKGTGIIHVNVEKDPGEDGTKNSRLIMRQQGTMKVMWNVRLFKGMHLLPRQVSDGDRRMDVYIKMVLVDNSLPKTYAIKLRNHQIMDQLYDAIQEAIPN